MASILADNTFKFKFVNENVLIYIKISLKFVPKGPINTIPALVQIIAWRWPGVNELNSNIIAKRGMILKLFKYSVFEA